MPSGGEHRRSSATFRHKMAAGKSSLFCVFAKTSNFTVSTNLTLILKSLKVSDSQVLTYIISITYIILSQRASNSLRWF